MGYADREKKKDFARQAFLSGEIDQVEWFLGAMALP
jgi:hypothetical protein